jgi:hypothetical protein
MKKLATLIIATGILVANHASAQNGQAGISFDMPLKTVIFKDPAASNPDKFFSSTSLFKFWVYKSGTTDDVQKMVSVFKEDPAVKQFSEGPATGDHKEFTLEMKTVKDKRWFVEKLKKSGVNAIKINTDQPKELDKL